MFCVCFHNWKWFYWFITNQCANGTLLIIHRCFSDLNQKKSTWVTAKIGILLMEHFQLSSQKRNYLITRWSTKNRVFLKAIQQIKCSIHCSRKAGKYSILPLQNCFGEESNSQTFSKEVFAHCTAVNIQWRVPPAMLFYKPSCRQINRKDSVIIMSVRPQAVEQELERGSRKRCEEINHIKWL